MGADSRVAFSELCGMLERMQRKDSLDQKKELLGQFIHQWKKVDTAAAVADGTSAAAGDGATSSFYPALRLLVPALDVERAAYGIKENTLAKYCIELLALGKDSPDALRLLNYRAPSGGGGGMTDCAGDFAAVAYSVLQPRAAASHQGGERPMTVRDVNDCLDRISLGNANKDRDLVRQQLLTLLKRLAPTECKWLFRVVLKEVKTGLSATSTLKVFHPDAEDLYNVSSSLSRVCRDLADRDTRLNEIEVQLFAPFRPMLADRVPATRVSQLIPSPTFLVTTKMDGERMQLHKQGDQYKYFSRGSKDYTSSFGSSSSVGPLTPELASGFPGVSSCILDGEMMAYSVSLQQFLSKGQHVDVKSLSGGGSDPDVHPCFVAFDLLLLNGTVLSNKPLDHRLQLLAEFVKPVEGYLEVVPQSEGTNTEDIISALNAAIDRHEEGIIIKDPASVYRPDRRKDSGWFKIKPDYEQNVMSDLDLLIIGGYRGTGRRSLVISHFLLALRHCTQFLSFCKIGSGYSDLQLKDMLKLLDPHWTNSQPINTNISAEKPEVFIPPEKSLVVTVRAAEMVESHKFATGFTLRFARLETIREDKTFDQAATKDEIVELWHNYKGKLATGHASSEEPPSPKKKRKAAAAPCKLTRRPVAVDDRFKSDLSGVERKSDVFNGREMCVLSVPPDHLSRQDVEKLVAENGGRVVQNPGRDTFCVVADRVTVRVRSVINAGPLCDVASVDWLLTCIQHGHMIPWQPHHMLAVSPDTHPLFLDQYGHDYPSRLIPST